MSIAFLRYAEAHKKDYAKLSVLGFSNGSHGNSIATLSCSDESLNNLNVPTFDWPNAPLPDLKYPLANHEQENRQEEDRCLDAFRKIIEDRRSAGSDVAAIIVEPITHFNNRSATPYFYKQLRYITKDEGVTMIVDETKTGMGTSGKMWAHEYWYLHENTPDIVTFGGKAGVSGFYSNMEHRTNSPCASFEQNVDMIQVLNFGVTWKAIQYEKLLELTHDTSSFLKIELGNI